MSILQEYKDIRKSIGEEKYNAIEKYLQIMTTEENYKKYEQEVNKLVFDDNITGKEYHKLDQQLKEKYNIILLSDVYYTKEGWNKFEEWYNKIQDVIITLASDDCIYSVAFWTAGNDELLKLYEDEYYFGMAYHSKDNSIKIYRFHTGDEDLEEWVTIGLKQEEITYIREGIAREQAKRRCK